MREAQKQEPAVDLQGGRMKRADKAGRKNNDSEEETVMTLFSWGFCDTDDEVLRFCGVQK